MVYLYSIKYFQPIFPEYLTIFQFNAKTRDWPAAAARQQLQLIQSDVVKLNKIYFISVVAFSYLHTFIQVVILVLQFLCLFFTVCYQINSVFHIFC